MPWKQGLFRSRAADAAVVTPSDPATTAPIPRGYLPTLDGWRAVAILAVMVAHAADQLLSPNGALPSAWLHGLTRYGGRGVDVFFGISGFLICSRLIEERLARGRIDLKGFYIRRCCRILPPYFAFLGVVSLLGAAGIFAVSGSELLSSLFFIRNYHTLTEPVGWYTGHLWSLAVEEHFYLIWPGLLAMWGIRRARWGVVALSLAIGAWRVIEFRLQLGAELISGLGFYPRTDLRLDALLWGCWFALIVSTPSVKERLVRLLSGPTWTSSLVLLIACIALEPPLAMVWQSVLIPLLVVGTVVRPAGRVARLLETFPMRWIGRLSYSLYLWQQVFLVSAAVERPLPFGVIQSLPLNVGMVFGVAAISYYLVERPMIRVGHRLAAPVTEGRV